MYHRRGAEFVGLVPHLPVVIGRGDDADLQVRDRSLSRRHAQFELVDGLVTVRDLGSLNGTVVRGEAISKPCQVELDEAIRLGELTVIVTSWTPKQGRSHQLADHERFCEALEDEVVRARAFNRCFALLRVRATRAASSKNHVWAARIRTLARQVDRVAVYGPGEVELLLPEAEPKQANAFAARLSADPAIEACSVVLYPQDGRTVDQLVAAASTRLSEKRRGVEPAPLADASDAVVIRSPAMLLVYERVDRVAPAPAPVLLLGETGTGKEILARRIHERSGRTGPLHCINCGAVPQDLIESTLFGHQKGAFTGAYETSRGAFEAANGGTIFLDELGELPARAQVALLRVVETGRVRRLGATDEVELDVRIIAATNRDLEDMVATGSFRSDLLYRLNMLSLNIPPLRARVSEIVPMAQLFLSEANGRYGRQLRLHPDVGQLLMRHTWPGNVRELRNVIDRAVLITQGDRIGVEDLPTAMQKPVRTYTSTPPGVEKVHVRAAPAELPFRDQIRSCEVALLSAALRATDGNQSAAARILDMPRRTLAYRVRSLDVSLEEISDVHVQILADLTEPGEEDLSYRQRLERIEIRILTRAMREDGDIASVARRLGMDPRTAAAKLERYNVRRG